VWDPVPNATQYNLYFSGSSGTARAGTEIANVTNPYTFTGLSNGTPVYFVVTAQDGAGESPPSSEVSATPTTAAHDMLLVAGGPLSIYDCYSQHPSSIPAASRTVTLDGGGFYSMAYDPTGGALYATAGNAIRIFRSPGTMSGTVNADSVVQNVLSSGSGITYLAIDVGRRTIYATENCAFTILRNIDSLGDAGYSGKSQFYDCTNGPGANTMLVDEAHDTLYGQRTTPGPINVMANVSAITGPADGGVGTLPPITKQITLANAQGNDNFAVDGTNDLLYWNGIPDGGAGFTAYVFTTTLSVAGPNSPVLNTVTIAPNPGAFSVWALNQNGNHLWILGSNIVYDIGNASSANGAVNAGVTPAHTVTTTQFIPFWVLYIP
jgi:hypothetical protein